MNTMGEAFLKYSCFHLGRIGVDLSPLWRLRIRRRGVIVGRRGVDPCGTLSQLWMDRRLRRRVNIGQPGCPGARILGTWEGQLDGSTTG